jgi:hypothetical protein
MCRKSWTCNVVVPETFVISYLHEYLLFFASVFVQIPITIAAAHAIPRVAAAANYYILDGETAYLSTVQETATTKTMQWVDQGGPTLNTSRHPAKDNRG